MLNLTRTRSSTDDERRYYTISTRQRYDRHGEDMLSPYPHPHPPCATTWQRHALAQISRLATMTTCPHPHPQRPTERNDDNECVRCDDTPSPSLFPSPSATSSRATSHDDTPSPSPSPCPHPCPHSRRTHMIDGEDATPTRPR